MDVFDLSAIIRLDSSQYEQGLSNAESKASGFGKTIKTAAKVGAGAFAAVGAAVIGTGVAITKGTGAVASYGDNIDKMSQKMGISAKAYQEWDAVLQHSGTSIDAMKRGMTTLAKAAESGKDSFSKLGITQEELQTLNQEELFARTIEGLQSMEEGTERTVLANELLGGSAKELGALLNTSAEDTQAMKDRVNELGGVMSDDAVKASARYQDSLQDMQTAFSGVSRNILSSFLPSMSTVMDGLTEIFGGDKEKGIGLVTEGVSGLLSNLEETIPKVIEVGGSIVSSIGQAISDNLPSIIEKGTQIVLNLATSLILAIPSIVNSAFVIVSTIISTISNRLPEILSKGAEIVLNIVDGIITNVPVVLTSISVMLAQLFANITTSLPEFVEKGASFLTSIITGILSNVPAVLASVAVMLGQLIARLLEALPEFQLKGAQFIINIMNGIMQNVPTVLAAVAVMLAKIIANIVTSLPSFLQKGSELVVNMMNGIVNNIPVILASIGVMLAQMAARIVESLPDFVQKGLEIIGNIVQGIIDAIPNLLSEVASIPGKIAQKFTEFDFASIGSNIMGGIKNGITSAASSVATAAKNAAAGAFNAAKSFLGINSPSKLFRDKIGKGITEGMALGIYEGTPEVMTAMDNMNDDAIANLDDIGYDVDTTVSRVGAEDKNNSVNAQLMEAVNYLTQTIEAMDESLQDKMLSAFEGMRFSVGNREFARMVRNVRTG